MIEDYRILIRIDRGVPTGKYEITRIGTKRAIIKCQEFYLTPVGELSPEEWRKRIKAEIEATGEMEMLGRIKDYCRTHCAWIRQEQNLEEYSMDILASRTYLKWADFERIGQEGR